MARYKNIKTGFVFDTSCTLSGKDWKEISGPLPIKEKKEEEIDAEKPIKTKRTKK